MYRRNPHKTLQTKYNYHKNKSILLSEKLEETVLKRNESKNLEDEDLTYELNIQLLLLKRELKRIWDIQIDLFFKLKEVNNG